MPVHDSGSSAMKSPSSAPRESSLWELLEARATEHANAPLFTFVGDMEGEEERLSHAGLLKRASESGMPRVARGFLRAGVSLHPDSAELWEALAKREKALGDAGAARVALRQARRAKESRAAQEARAPQPSGR